MRILLNLFCGFFVIEFDLWRIAPAFVQFGLVMFCARGMAQ